MTQERSRIYILPPCSGHVRMSFTSTEYTIFRASLVAQMVKRLPAMQETWVRTLGWEDPLEKEMATHCSTLAWKIPWTEEPSRLQSMVSQSLAQLSNFTFTFTFHTIFMG